MWNVPSSHSVRQWRCHMQNPAYNERCIKGGTVCSSQMVLDYQYQTQIPMACLNCADAGKQHSCSVRCDLQALGVKCLPGAGSLNG